MSEKIGPRTFGKTQELIFLGKEITEEKDYSPETARLIDNEINKIINDKKETLERSEFLEILQKIKNNDKTNS